VTDEAAIAVVGAGCRFPDAWSPRQFWDNVDRGVVSMRELSDEQLRAGGVPEERLRRPDYVRVGTTLPGVADFAADFFGCTPKQARGMDPQQRIFLEACWEALELAGHPPDPEGGPVIGVFAGSAAGTYSVAMLAAAVNRMGLADAVDDLDLTVDGEPDFLTSRVAYKLGLRGPAVSVQTACSSSLYAVHFATLSLLSGECDIALAGGATVLEPVRGYRYRPDGGQSDDGYCRPFDYRATGTAYSSGVGVVALRRLADALADGDDVLAVLRGTAVGNDGALKAGFAAPSPAGVADVAAAALRVGGVSGDLVRYVEAHGTATPLGDQVELAALTTALRATTDRVGFCGLGSVKANIGHTGPASSIAGFLAAVHVARTGALPPHPTFERAREPGVLAESPFVIHPSGHVCADPDLHVLVNSIGFGGGNAAAVLGRPPVPVRASAPERGPVRLVLSARSRVELDRMSAALADVVDAGALPLADVAHTLRVGRRDFPERRVVTAAPRQVATALRLPRPPLARTVRSDVRRGVIALPEGSTAPPELVRILRAALPDVPVVGPEDVARDADAFVIAASGPGDPAEAAEAALCAAWLHGVPVRWSALANGHGRRVGLPTYPFQRTRHWALDDLAREARPEARPAPAPTGDSIDGDVLAVWREVFDSDAIGPDDEFTARGGTSLLSVQLVLEVQERFGVVANLHRAGGSKATPRRLADLVRGLLGMTVTDQPRADRMDAADDHLVDADLQLPLGPVSDTPTRGRDLLLTGAAGYLGAFLLHHLQSATANRIYCLVRADGEADGMARLRAAAAKFLLAEPDPDRVHVVPGDLRDIDRVARDHRGGELIGRVGHVLHCAARVVFTEPYRNVREDNVLPMAALLTWMRGHGIRDLSFVSTTAVTAPAPGADQVLETRDQPLDPRLGGYGVSKWVGERLADRADLDGMRVRVFRPGLIMSARATGAGNARDLIYFVLASGVAVGAHPVDDRLHDLSPVDVVSRAIAELALSPGSVGRAYHLIDERLYGLSELFAMLARAGLPTEPVPLARWQELVRERARATGNPVLSAAALLEIEGADAGAPRPRATNWQPWLRRTGLEPGVDGDLLRAGLTYLARTDPLFGAILPELAGATPALATAEEQ
jgi:thioester reductase-like protein